MKPHFGIRYGPHLVALSVGYVVFSYAAVPGIIMAEFEVGFTAVGLLMSVVLVSFVGVQTVGGRLVNDRPTLPILLLIAIVSAVLSTVLDLVTSFGALLGLRAVWGLVGGLAVTVCATHISRVYQGATATWHQSLNGGMFTFGGAVAFLLTPRVMEITGWFGLHAISSLIAIPAIVVLWKSRHQSKLTRPRTDSTIEKQSESRSHLEIFHNRIVVLAAVCNVATLGAYITLSTFVTAYFDDVGIAGPLNAFALLIASLGRFGGGIAMVRPEIEDGMIIAIASGIGAVSLLVLIAGEGIFLVILPLFALAAVSLPFGAIFKTTAASATRDATAVAIVVAAGNAGGLALPAITGWIRDTTGGYDGAFAVLALLNLGAVVAGVVISRQR